MAKDRLYKAATTEHPIEVLLYCLDDQPDTLCFAQQVAPEIHQLLVGSQLQSQQSPYRELFQTANNHLLSRPLLDSQLHRKCCELWCTARVAREQHDFHAIQRKHILLAEDHRVNQMVASAMLKRLGHQVTVAVNGQEVVEQFQQQSVDLILMDCQMPELDGFEATRQIQKFRRKAQKPAFQSLP